MVRLTLALMGTLRSTTCRKSFSPTCTRTPTRQWVMAAVPHASRSWRVISTLPHNVTENELVGQGWVRFSYQSDTEYRYYAMGAIKFVPIFFVYSFGFLDTDLYNTDVNNLQRQIVQYSFTSANEWNSSMLRTMVVHLKRVDFLTDML